MNYQQVLSIPYVFHLVNEMLDDTKSDKNIVKMEKIYYIKEFRGILTPIEQLDEKLRRTHNNIICLLDTFIQFEETKKNPINNIFNRKRLGGYPRNIDHEVFKNLQMQYATDKSYFNDENFNLLLPK
tara:strand:- start:96 stop:476 length:381 start_codon:yes stop_codon:yes gene_type:complete